MCVCVCSNVHLVTTCVCNRCGVPGPANFLLSSPGILPPPLSVGNIKLVKSSDLGGIAQGSRTHRLLADGLPKCGKLNLRNNIDNPSARDAVTFLQQQLHRLGGHFQTYSVAENSSKNLAARWTQIFGWPWQAMMKGSHSTQLLQKMHG